ncbi:MAG: HEPN domain-containing protein [Gemmatimonadales bacterium]
MKPPEEVKREFVRQWLRKGLADLTAARHLLSGGAELSYGAAFHAQQAAEKLLKAVLVWHQVEFPKTHDIGRLVELVYSADPPLADRTREAAALTPYGVEARYPGDLCEPTLGEARLAMTLAERVRDAVLQHLPPEFGTTQT